MNRFFTLAMLADNEMPTIGELIDELFSLNLGDYDNLGISASTLTGLRGIIVALFIGVIIGAISSMFNRRVLGDFVRALTSGGCRTPESAKTLAELGFLKNTAVRASLRAGGVLRAVPRGPLQTRYFDGAFLHPGGEMRQRGDALQKKRNELGGPCDRHNSIRRAFVAGVEDPARAFADA